LFDVYQTLSLIYIKRMLRCTS